MKIELNKDGYISREQIWLIAWCSVATASTCHVSKTATNWADICLQEYDKRFKPAPKPDTKESES